MSRRPEHPLVIAHRGASAYKPENTLPAYELAVDQCADMIEIDLHRTRDGSIVIAHDRGLERLGSRGTIAESTLAEIKALDAGYGSDTPAQVPTLEEVLDAFGERIPFNLEIKWSESGDYPGLEAQALSLLESRGLVATTLFSCFRESVLVRLRRLDPDVRLALLVDPRGPAEQRERMLERAHALGAEALNPSAFLVTEERVRQAHE
ncbi:MAG: glycerophosphodiester phosphodiesterase family protein, partial [Myxococcota bacterium]